MNDYEKSQIGMALDLLQIITEDVEENFLCKSVKDNAVRARVTMTISALYVLNNYLRAIGEEAQA